MEILSSKINSSDPNFKENQSHHLALAKELRARLKVVEGGGPSRVERHEKRGKLFVRDRIKKLLDSGSPFLELSALAATDLYDGNAHGAAIQKPSKSIVAVS